MFHCFRRITDVLDCYVDTLILVHMSFRGKKPGPVPIFFMIQLFCHEKGLAEFSYWKKTSDVLVSRLCLFSCAFWMTHFSMDFTNHYLREESNALTMVDVVMAGSLEEYEFSGTVREDVEMERKNADEVAEVEVEDGELPEEGEICDDEDAEGRDRETVENLEAAEAISPNASLNQPTLRKPRDFDKEAANARGAEGSMLSSWMTGVKQRAKPGIATIASPTVDANEEYYGYGNNSPSDGTGDKDYRNRGGDAADKDYRWIRDEDGHRGPGDINEFGDSDYRGGSPKLERRRRRSISPTYGGPKRPRHSPPVRGCYRGRGFRGRWGERQICKFFREGYCRDGDSCSYSHDAADSGRKAELCKFYQQGFCKKGLQCPLLHGEYPCKAFHKGECSKDPCQFSHLPLNSFTQPIFDQMMKDDELASRIAIPQGPLKRRVLLPGGPSSSPGAQPTVPAIVTVTADGGIAGNVIPPPAVVVPTLSSAAPPVTIAQPQLVIPPPLAANPTPYPAFFPHHSVPATAVVNSTSLSSVVSGLGPPQPTQSATAILQQYSANVDKRNSQEDEEDTSFNINKMLEQITAKVKKDTAIDDSPASPPMFNPDAVADENAPTIPETNVLAWKLHPIDDIPSPQTNIDSQILQMSLTDAGLRNDPRIKKALSSQFDAFTTTLMNAAPPPLPQPAQIFVQQSTATASTSTVQSSVASVLPKEESSVQRLADPRMSTLNRDPRKRATVSDPRVTSVSDSRLVSTTAPTLDPRLAPPYSLMQMAQMPSTSTSRVGVDHIYVATVQTTQSRDQDHRLHSSGYENSHVEEHITERIGGYENRRSSGGNWMPQIRAAVDPRQVKRYVIGGYRNEPNSTQDRDERALNRARGEGTKSPSNNSPSTAAATLPQAPLSLREKRKNNEYESPLSRIPEKTRWT
uniref:C3H1-type domain-containing protein n=1 Tax=Setaria digitata TaxID=48799 RepID=A0A915PKU3_9BILA